MLRGLQPLKLLGNATATAKEPSRPPAFDYEKAEQDVDDDNADDANSDNDDVPIFSSPMEQEEAITAAATPSDASEQPSTPVMAPMTMDPVPQTPRRTPSPRSQGKDSESDTSTTLVKPSAVDDSGMTKQATMPSLPTTITPCLKEKGGPTTTTTTKKKTKRPSLAEQTHESSLTMAQKLVQYTETTCKTLQDEYKRVQKVVKRLQQQLQEAQDLQQQVQTQLDEAMKHKKDATKEYKTLTKLWEKYSTSETKKELVHKEELNTLKEAMKKRRVEQGEMDAVPTKKRKSDDHSANKHHKTKTSKKSRKDSDDESSDSETDQGNNSSEDEDSDWEGRARKTHRQASRTAPSDSGTTSKSIDAAKRTSGRRKAGISKDWACPTCTLLNPPDLEECDACGTPK